jgi:hypothetical protein
VKQGRTGDDVPVEKNPTAEWDRELIRGIIGKLTKSDMG